MGDIRAGFPATRWRSAHEKASPGAHPLLDPGFGFGWTPGQNLECFAALLNSRVPVTLLVGTSRKSTTPPTAVLGEHRSIRRLEGTPATVATSLRERRRYRSRRRS
ncbi:MAG: hypothetical protein IPO34_15860 [Dehalococcoidia bacterium]|nr:hypothetical protein [Dehalococcoidia bacterium]